VFATSGVVSIQRVDDSKTIQTASPPPDVTPELSDAATGQCVSRGAGLARQAVFLPLPSGEKRDITRSHRSHRAPPSARPIEGRPGLPRGISRPQFRRFGGVQTFGPLAAALIEMPPAASWCFTLNPTRVIPNSRTEPRIRSTSNGGAVEPRDHVPAVQARGISGSLPRARWH